MHRVKVLKMFTIVTLLCVILLILTKGRLYRRNVDVITMDKGSNRSRKQFINPYLKNGSIVGKRSYFRMIESLSPKQLDELLLQFNVKGIQYLTKNAKLDFLWCDSEIRTGLPVSNRIRNCTEMTFKEDTGKRVALASFPGSGSTWSRTLLEQATGIYTGAVYCDRKLRGQGFLGEQITSRNVIAIKTHSGQGPRDRYDAVILVIRNIFDAVKSEINRRSSARNHTGIASDYDKSDPKWLNIISTYLKRYLRITTSWLDNDTNIPTLVVRYEDMLRDTRRQLRRMLDFLNYPYTEDRLDCVLNHQIQTFHRRHHRNFDPFTSEQKRNFVRIMKQVEPLLNLYNTSYRDVIATYDG